MSEKLLVIEIEDKKGNTKMAVKLDISNYEDIRWVDEINCTVASIEPDYLFDSDAPLVRVQED